MNIKPCIRFGISIITPVLFLLLFQSIAFAEPHFQSNIDTPTVAPTKTAIPAPTAAQSATSLPTQSLLSDTKTFKAFTQADLSILTGNIQRPNGLVWYDNKIYTSCSGDWTLYEIDAETGTTSQYLYGVKNAHSILATSDDTGLSLWMPDFQSNTVTQINKGVSKSIASNLNGPWGIAPVNDGRFLISNLHTNNVIVVGSGDSQEIIKELRSPTGIAVDTDYVYVANTGSARRAIEWFNLSDIMAIDANVDASDKAVNRSLISGLQNVTNIMVAADGFLYFNYALGTRGVVGRIDPVACREKGGCSNSEVEIVLYSELAAPLAGLTISPDMRLYVHSIYSPDIYWLDLDDTPSSP